MLNTLNTILTQRAEIMDNPRTRQDSIDEWDRDNAEWFEREAAVAEAPEQQRAVAEQVIINRPIQARIDSGFVENAFEEMPDNDIHENIERNIQRIRGLFETSDSESESEIAEIAEIDFRYGSTQTHLEIGSIHTPRFQDAFTALAALFRSEPLVNIEPVSPPASVESLSSIDDIIKIEPVSPAASVESLSSIDDIIEIEPASPRALDAILADIEDGLNNIQAHFLNTRRTDVEAGAPVIRFLNNVMTDLFHLRNDEDPVVVLRKHPKN